MVDAVIVAMGGATAGEDRPFQPLWPRADCPPATGSLRIQRPIICAPSSLPPSSTVCCACTVVLQMAPSTGATETTLQREALRSIPRIDRLIGERLAPRAPAAAHDGAARASLTFCHQHRLWSVPGPEAAPTYPHRDVNSQIRPSTHSVTPSISAERQEHHARFHASAAGNHYRHLCWSGTKNMRNMTDVSDTFAICSVCLERRAHATSMDITKIAQHGLAMRQWEREHLPTADSQLGYEVFMKLAELVASTGQGSLLKQLYLALPYSEKAIRLHLRRLESAGWITVKRTGDDGRAAQFALSNSYWRLLETYATQWQLQTMVAD